MGNHLLLVDYTLVAIIIFSDTLITRIKESVYIHSL